MKARISQLHMTEANWLSRPQWIPEAGELVIYDPDDTHSYARIKVGDGVHTLQELDFFIESTIKAVLKQMQQEDPSNSGRIKATKLEK